MTMNRVRFAAVAAFTWLIAVTAPGASAQQFEITKFDGDVINQDGTAASQAGGHPWEVSGRADFPFDPVLEPAFGSRLPVELVRNVRIELPPGFVGNPTAVPTCTWDELTGRGQEALCPMNSQVGALGVNGAVGGPDNPAWAPLYNMEAPPGHPAALGANIAGIPAVFFANVRPTDYGVDLTVENISQISPFTISALVVWGAPADVSHNRLRTGKVAGEGVFDVDFFTCMEVGPAAPKPQPWPSCPPEGYYAGIPKRPYLSNPTSCSAPGVGLETRIHVESWVGSRDSASFFTHHPAPNENVQVGTTGCERVPFDPSISVQPDVRRPDAATGLEVDLRIPQNENPDGIAQGHLKRAEVTLPEGMTISPSAADGLDACSDGQLKLGSSEPAACPDGSKIGTVAVDTPLLEEELGGSVFIRTQNSSDPASGEMFRIAIEIRDDERGIDVKLPGSVIADPATGRLTTVFDNNPQLPFESMRLRLKSGDRAPLATPSSCGEKTVQTRLSSWSGKTVELTDRFTIDCPGDGGFSPTFDAGTVTPTGGSFSPFVLRIDRDRGEQFLSDLSVRMPEGLIAKLKGVQLCPDQVAGDGSPGVCPVGSRIGSATVGSGPGAPFFLRGDVYLTGPYQGAPYGLSVQVPATAGPFDLGMVKVRQALHVDPTTAAITAESDPLPQVVKGVPVRLRSVNADIDRRDFTINPTSCSAKRIEATFQSTGGATAEVAEAFRAVGCRGLGFKPKLKLTLSGKRQTTTGRHPGLRAVLTQPAGQANVAKAKVALPKSIALDAQNAYDPKLVCDYDRSLKADCPASSVIGKAVANTPVLERPLTGNVHLVQGIKFGKSGNRIRTLPTLLVKLRGEVAINLRGQTSTSKTNQLVTTFGQVPDAPVNRFTMNIRGGGKGILVVTRTRRSKLDLCRGRQVADIETDGQNGRRTDFSVQVKTACANKSNNKSKRRGRGKQR